MRVHPRRPLRGDHTAVGARYRAVASGGSTLTYFEVDPATEFPEHSHCSEQTTMVLTGRLRFRFAAGVVVLGPGEAVTIPAGVPHAVSSLGEAVTAVDTWFPALPTEELPASRGVPLGGSADGDPPAVGDPEEARPSAVTTRGGCSAEAAERRPAAAGPGR